MACASVSYDGVDVYFSNFNKYNFQPRAEVMAEEEWAYDQEESSDEESESSDGEPVEKKRKDECDVVITQERANEIWDQSGRLVESKEDEITLVNVCDVTHPVTIFIKEAMVELGISYKLTDGQIRSLHSIASCQDTIIVLPCGYGKMAVFFIGTVILRKIKNKPNGIGLCLQPTNDLSEEKLRSNPVMPTAFLTRSGGVKYSEEPNVTQSLDTLARGEYGAVLASAEAFAEALEEEAVAKWFEENLIFGAIDEGFASTN